MKVNGMIDSENLEIDGIVNLDVLSKTIDLFPDEETEIDVSIVVKDNIDQSIKITYDIKNKLVVDLGKPYFYAGSVISNIFCDDRRIGGVKYFGDSARKH